MDNVHCICGGDCACKWGDHRAAPDPDLTRPLARDAILGLNQLLTGQPPGEVIACHRVAALVRLIADAVEPDAPGPKH